MKYFIYKYAIVLIFGSILASGGWRAWMWEFWFNLIIFIIALSFHDHSVICNIDRGRNK